LKIIIIFIILFLNCKPNQNAESKLLLDLIQPKNPFKVYFSYPDRDEPKEKSREALDRILQLISNAKNKIQIYAYSFNQEEIIEALDQARNRGIEISFILDKKNDYTKLQEKKFSYRIWTGSGLHHIKAILFDSKILFYGTGNFSRTGLTASWNGFIEQEIQNPEEIISFLEMKNDRLFAYESGVKFLFSPEKGVLIQNEILQTIENAEHNVKLLIFDHFDEILSHVLRKASAKGIQVIGIYNSPVDPEGKYLQNQLFGLTSQIYRDGNSNRIPFPDTDFPEGGLLHHKTIVVDDKILLTGSYNFSISARDSNRELFIKTSEPFLVQGFLKEFERIKAHSYLEKRNFQLGTWEIQQLNSLDPQRICSPRGNKGIWELQLGIFSFYSYWNKNSKKCFSYREMEDISTGLTTLRTERVLQAKSFWDGVKFYERENPLYLESQTIPSKFSDFYNPVSLQNYEFTKDGKLILRFREEISIPQSVQLFSPGQNLVHLDSIEINGKEWVVNNFIPSSYRSKMMFLIHGISKNYMTCVSTSNSQAFRYLVDLIQWKLENPNLWNCAK
jgi:phosphatidylserine/phosphatidylglycerophosphate/cardiolipin synthase-like enzyme